MVGPDERETRNVPSAPNPAPYPTSNDMDNGSIAKRRRPRQTLAIILVIIALVFLVIVLHITGIIGPGLHGGNAG